jgi:antitoxin (DNA-binding transcriptional repressor) of toxin-antitoxin stability system
MEQATVSKLKDKLSAYLRKVRAGHAVVIDDRDVPIARLERIESAGAGSDRLALLRAQGLPRPPLRSLSPARLHATLARGLARSVGGARRRATTAGHGGAGRFQALAPVHRRRTRGIVNGRLKSSHLAAGRDRPLC